MGNSSGFTGGSASISGILIGGSTRAFQAGELTRLGVPANFERFIGNVAAWHCACNQLSCHIHASREALQDERRRFAFREALQAGQEEIERRFTKKHTVSHFFWLRYRHCAQAKFGSKGERGSQQ